MPTRSGLIRLPSVESTNREVGVPPLATIGTRQQPARVSDGLIATPLRTLRPQISDPRHPNLTLRYKVPLDPGLRTDYGRIRSILRSERCASRRAIRCIMRSP